MSRHSYLCKMPTENIQTTVGALNSEFSGRRDTPDYDETKRTHIHRRNRAYAWSIRMQQDLLDSMLRGFYIAPIICSTRIIQGPRPVERREVMDGGNRITTFRNILLDKVKILTPGERQIVMSFPITVVVTTLMDAKDQRDMFRRLNKSVAVSDGQLYAMSDDSALVREALQLLDDDAYPLRSVISSIFFDTQGKDNDGKNNLANAVALVSGAVHGVDYITKSYNIQEECLEGVEIPREKVLEVLTPVFDVFTQVDLTHPIDGRKRRGQWNVGKYLGAMMYDYLTTKETRKWVEYLIAVRSERPFAEEAVKLGGAQNLTANRYKRICTKVHIYLTENRIATDEELKPIVHSTSSEDDEESYVSDSE